jgi:predicted secreted protein
MKTMKQKNILKAVVTMAVTFAFIMPVTALGTMGKTESTGYSYMDNIAVPTPGTKESAVATGGPGELWNKTFGGPGYDIVGGGSSVQQTTDGGYIIIGQTNSFGAGGYDFYLIKTASNGTEEWDMTFGGGGDDAGYGVQQTSDGGYIITGSTESFGAGGQDVWLIKTASNGTEAWSKTFGGASGDAGYAVQQTSDGGYIITGATYSFGAGGRDVWLIKTASNGTEEWSKTFGGASYDAGFGVQQTTDGGYIMTGFTMSYGAGSSDVWLIKASSSGAEEWNKTFGGPGYDGGVSVQQTSDGGYVATAITSANGFDVLLIKTASNGTEEWEKTFGGPGFDVSNSVAQTADGGYVVTGLTTSLGAGGQDGWLIKTASDGTEEWNETFGGTGDDQGSSVRQTPDGGYIIAGGTKSYGAGDYDVWLIRVASGNHPPSAPAITGTTHGKVKVEYGYNFSLADPDNDAMYLRVDWGNGTPGPWQGPYDSGTTVRLNHSWNKKGDFTIRAQAKDVYGNESAWGTLIVTMPLSYEPPHLRFLTWLFERFPHAFPLLRQLLGY